MADDRRQDGADDLDQRIKDAQDRQRHAMTNEEGRAESRGWAVGIEFIGAVLVSGLIGFGIDKWLDTGPWAMIVLLILGFAAGTRRAMKTSASFDSDPDTGNRK
ncbi:AtpZ/AtpI family protein [Novosphingopyxis sp.]|uniref:AtpZ/AtpI family protein n=1 Tax=Novosphingopyxis sp. TaxID=2709690 RepID=UPI003B5BE6A2